MTIPSTARKAGPLLGTGAQTAWPFTFKVFAAGDVAVTIANSAGVETALTLDSDYSVTLNANQETSPGGTVTYPISGDALPVGSVLSIVGDLDYDQVLDLPSGGNFSPTALENQLDRSTMQIQQLVEEMSRTAKLPPTSSESVADLVDDLQRIADSADNLDTVAGSIASVNTVASNVASVNTVAGAIANVNAVGASIADVNTVAGAIANVNTVAGIQANVTAVAGIAANVTAVAGNATNINTVAGIAADISTVAVNVADVTNFADVYQGAKATDPTVRNDLGPLQAGDLYFNTADNALRAYSGTLWVAGTAGTVSVQTFSGDASETAFTLVAAPASENNTQVYISGVYQAKSEYSVSGVTLTFGAAPPLGVSNIEVVTISTLALGETDAALVSYTPAGTGAVATTVQAKLRERVSVKDFGAVGNGVANDTTAIQAALNYCYSVSKDLFIPSGIYLISAQLLNKGVSMIGEGRFYSQLLLSTAFPAATNVILVQPDDGAYIDFLELGRFSVQPTNGGTKYGGTAIYMNFPQATNLSRLHIHDLYLLPGNDYSLQVNNNNVINFQGVPANSVIERCMFWEGMKLLKIGDSVTIRNNVLRSSGGGRVGVNLYVSDTSGVASHVMIVENNIDCVGGALYVERGRSIKFNYNNVELSAGSGTANGAIVDMHGSSGVMPWCEVTGNHIGVFGTATPTSAVRVNAAQGCTVDKNTILSGIAVASAILVTASASDTDVGFNEIQSNYTTAISNSGLRTMGAPLALGMLNSFTNTGGGYQTLAAYKSRTGLVTISGVVNAPASPSGVIIATLPLGYRPTTIQRFSASTVTGGSIVGYSVEVDVSGNIVCYCAVNTTRIEINATFQTLNYVSGSL